MYCSPAKNSYSLCFLILVVTTIFAFPVFAQEAKNAKVESTEERAFEGNIHKRLEWFEARQLAGPEKNISIARGKGYQEFRSAGNHISMKNSALNALPAWKQLGASQDQTTSGRTTCLAFDPTDNKTMYLGTAQGGLWKTTDFGSTWINLSERWETLRVGAVAIDPQNSNILYAGTGDPDPAPLSEASYRSSTDGVGIYKSTDKGLNWTLWAKESDIESRIFQIEIHPQNSDIIYVSGHTGLCVTTDGGQSWKRLLTFASGYSNSGLISFVLNPQNPSHIVAAGNSKVFRSLNAGITWDTMSAQRKTAGLPSFSRGTVALCESSPNVVYLSASNSGGQLAGLCLSTDFGSTWRTMSIEPNYLFTQGWYANAIAVDPNNPAHVIVGGLDVYQSKDSGKSVYPVSFYWQESSSSQYTHADIHRLIIRGDKVFTLSDGGIFHSNKDVISWVSTMNVGLGTLQFVGIDANPDFTYAVGGTQDNGMNRIDINTGSFFSKTGDGDGGYTRISQTDGQIVYSTYYNANFRKSTNGGRNWVGGGRNMISNDTLRDENTPFYMSFDVHEKNPNLIVICGNSRVWLSKTGATGQNSFLSISKNGEIPGGPSAAHIATADERIIYAASGQSVNSSHYVYVKIGDNKWRRSKTKVGYVTQIISDPNDPGHAYISTAGYGNPHFYETVDTGYTWTATAVNLPDVSCNAIARAANGELFIANEFGVLRSADNGRNWFKLDNGLPLVQVLTLQIRANGTRLLAGTYGRGAYYLDLTQLPVIPVNDVTQPNKAITTDALSIDAVFPDPITPNASFQSTINFTTKEHGIVDVVLYDMLGRELRTFAHDYKAAGKHSVRMDLFGLPSGKYFCTVTSNGITLRHLLTISR